MEGTFHRPPAWMLEPERLAWAVRVRWAVIVGFTTLAAGLTGLGLEAHLPSLLAAGAVGILGNGVNDYCVRKRRWIVPVTAVALAMDNALITFASARSGGIRSPLVLMYSVQVVATAMLVSSRAALCSTALAAVGLAVLGSAEANRWHDYGATAGPGFVAGDGAVFWLPFLAYGLSLLVFVGGFISERLRRSEAVLADQNRELARTVASLATARDELDLAYGRLKQAEARLVQAEKMRALGQIVAGVAHELNNPISFVSSNIGALRDSFGRLARLAAQDRVGAGDALQPILEDLPLLLDDCEEGARRVKRIVTELRTFARPAAEQADLSIDVRDSLERTLRLVRHRAVDGVRLETDLAPTPSVRGHLGQLDQVFLNLLANAFDAVEERGCVRVWSLYDVGAHAVRVRIADDGPGISPAHLARVFEPFFTTKEPGRGTGLGLSVSHAIVERHGGTLTAESNVGEGAVFEVSLPVQED